MPLAEKAPDSQGTKSALLNQSSPPYLVATLIDDLQDMWGQRRVFPGSDGIRDLATFGGDAVVLTEYPPVPVCHLI